MSDESSADRDCSIGGAKSVVMTDIGNRVSDRRGFNQPPGNDISLKDLRQKLETSFGHSLESSEGDVKMKLLLYRQNTKILAEQAFVKKQLNRLQTQLNRPTFLPITNSCTGEELGLPITNVQAFR